MPAFVFTTNTNAVGAGGGWGGGVVGERSGVPIQANLHPKQRQGQCTGGREGGGVAVGGARRGEEGFEDDLYKNCVYCRCCRCCCGCCDYHR